MPKKKGDLIFDASIFYKLIEDCSDYYDQDITQKGDLKPRDIYKYYLDHKDETKENGKPRYPKFSESIIYKRADVREYLDQINKIRRNRLGTGVLVDTRFIKEDFDWYPFYLGHMAQKDCGLEELGEMINSHREQIRGLFNKVEVLTKKLETEIKTAKSYKKKAEANESRIESLEKQLESARSSEEKYKKLYEDMKFFIGTQAKTFATMEETSSANVTTIVSPYIREHSYKGEENGETPSLAELRKRYPKRNENEDKK